jgi:hypothetical protein
MIRQEFLNFGKQVFTIQYDSLTQVPSMFYPKDTTWKDMNNPGTFLSSTRLVPVDSAIVNIKRVPKH